MQNEIFPVISTVMDRDQWLQCLNMIIAAIEAKRGAKRCDAWPLRRSMQQRCFLASGHSVHSYQTKTERVIIHGEYHYNLL